MERSLRPQRSLSKQATLDDAAPAAAPEDKSSLTNHAAPTAVEKPAKIAAAVTPAPTEKAANDKRDKPPPPPPRTNGVVGRGAGGDEEGKKNGQVEEKVPVSRNRQLAKMKLLQRSHAMREETSPPPDPDAHAPAPTPAPKPAGQASNGNNNNNNSLSVRPASRHKLSRQGSSRDSTDSASPCLSRENSTEQYTDFTGTDLEHFIIETINRNYKDRTLMLQIEQQLVNYIRDLTPPRNVYKFSPMSSYQRMLVHRVAAYFGMDHNVDTPGNCVVVSKTKNTRIPEVAFKAYVKEDLLFPEEPRRSILKRDSSSFEDGNFKESGGDGAYSRRSSPDDIRWPGDIQPWSSSEGDNLGRPHHPRNATHLRADTRSSRMLKVESFEGGDTLKAGSLRMSVSKSYSFGGYSVAGSMRTDAGSANRLLTKQDSGSSMSSRISPGSSSGYKSQSQRSDATLSATPSPTATPHPHPHSSQVSPHGGAGGGGDGGGNTVMWAVTDMAAVPPGSMLINPQTGMPYTNPDGSVYRYDPANPLKSKPEESKSVSTQMTPEPSLPPSPAKSAAPVAQLSSSCPSKSTTTTSTSPSFPSTPPPPPASHPPPPPPPQQQQQQQQQQHQHNTYKAMASTELQPSNQLMPLPINSSQAMMGAYTPNMYSMPQQVDPGMMYANPANLQCHNQPPGQVVYTGYNMGPPYDQRQPMPADGCNMSMTDLNGYFMNMNMNMNMNMMSDQHRGAGDTAGGQVQQQGGPQQQQQQQPPAAYQPQHNGPAVAAAQPNTAYWQPTQCPQPQAGMPMYYTIPHPGAAPLLTSSPPQPPGGGGGNQVPQQPQPPRYMGGYQQGYQQQQPPQPPTPQDSRQANGGYMTPNSYPMGGYAGPLPGPPMMNSSGDCLPPGVVYGSAGPAIPYYTPGVGGGGQGPQYAPVQPNQPGGGGGGGSYRAPTPPQTPSHAQPICAPSSYVYLNGGPGYPMGVYNGGPATVGPTPPGPATQYMPAMPIFRPAMQMMRGSPPPRPPREGGAGSKPPYSRSPSVGSNKDRPFDASPRYPSMPMFRVLQGDIRGLVGPPLQGGVRMQFSLPPHHPNSPRGPGTHHQAYSQQDNRARKPRPKSMSHSQLNNQSRSPQSNGQSHLGAFGGNNDTGIGGK